MTGPPSSPHLPVQYLVFHVDSRRSRSPIFQDRECFVGLDDIASGNRVVQAWIQYRFAGGIETMAGSAMAGIPALKETYQLLRTRMEKAVEDFRTNLASIRTGRASVHMLDQIKVMAYGT